MEMFQKNTLNIITKASINVMTKGMGRVKCGFRITIKLSSDILATKNFQQSHSDRHINDQ